MKLRLQTDYALRALMYLAGTPGRCTADEIADAFVISKDHLVKIVQQLGRLGYVRTFPGRGGGIALAQRANEIQVRSIIEAIEGSNHVMLCIEDASVCPMEPGCHLRKLLIKAEAAFYDSLDGVTIADLIRGKQRGGLTNLVQLKK